MSTSHAHPPRIVFGGDRPIAVDVLRYLKSQGVEPLGLILPEPGQGSHSQELRTLCADLPPDRVWTGKFFRDPGTIETLNALHLDYLVCIHLPVVMPSPVLAIPKHGVLNLHPAYLPYNRGWHTSSWALLEGTTFGATLHFMSEIVDAGDIVHQKSIMAGPGDTADTLYKRALHLEFQVFKEAWPALASFSYSRKPQAMGEGTSHKRKDLLAPGVQEIDLESTVRAGDLLRKVRALTTSKLEDAAYFFEGGRQFRIQVRITEETAKESDHAA